MNMQWLLIDVFKYSRKIFTVIYSFYNLALILLIFGFLCKKKHFFWGWSSNKCAIMWKNKKNVCSLGLNVIVVGEPTMMTELFLTLYNIHFPSFLSLFLLFIFLILLPKLFVLLLSRVNFFISSRTHFSLHFCCQFFKIPFKLPFILHAAALTFIAIGVIFIFSFCQKWNSGQLWAILKSWSKWCLCKLNIWLSKIITL